MISDAAFAGAIQVPPSGDPILLLADHQTTGGYPQLAVVITADIPLAAQLAPGGWWNSRVLTVEHFRHSLPRKHGSLPLTEPLRSMPWTRSRSRR